MGARQWIAAVAACAGLVAACGAEPERAGSPATSEVTPAPTSVRTLPDATGAPASTAGTTASTPPPPPTPPATSAPAFEVIDVDCGAQQPGSTRALVTAQELVFDGTVTEIRAERNPEAAFRATYLDDGQEDPGGPVPDEGALDDPTAGALWPWTTFAVEAWFTRDWGPEITIWTAGLDLAVGNRVLVAGEAFTTAIPENVPYSGLAVVCASAPYDAALDARWREWFGGTVEPGGEEPEGQAAPAAVAEIEAGRVRWREGRPESYAASITIGGPPIDGPCGPTLSAVVTVTGDTVTSAVAPDGCRLDPSAAGLPLIDDVFDQAIRAQAALEHTVELDPTWGFPRSFSGTDRAVELYGGVEWFHAAAATLLVDEEIAGALADLRQRWAVEGPASYSFVLEELCFCDNVGPYRVTVVDGEPARIALVDGSVVVPAARLPVTIDEVFAVVERAVADSDRVVGVFDAALGYPVRVDVDAIREAVDDEVTWIVRDLAPG